jgi:hypothetical protein
MFRDGMVGLYICNNEGSFSFSHMFVTDPILSQMTSTPSRFIL